MNGNSNWVLNGSMTLAGGIFSCSGSGRAEKIFVLNQKVAMPVRISAESSAESVHGINAYEYSFLAQIEFTDGTTNRLSWAPFNDGTLFFTDYAPFPNGTHAFVKRNFVLNYEKTIRTIKLLLLFERHEGCVQFQNVEVCDYAVERTPLFDTFPLVNSLPEPGFFLRDCKKNSGTPQFLPDPAIDDVLLKTTRKEQNGAVFFSVNATLTGKTARTLTLYYTEELAGESVEYLPEIDRSVPADLPKDYFDTATWRVGANGLAARFPFTAVRTENRGTAIGFLPESPAFGRVGYNHAVKRMFIAFDFALTPEVPNAVLEFVVFSFQAKHGFRGALAEYYSLFPENYTPRITDQGNWMAFVDISTLPDYEDFHFRFKEGNTEPAWDREHNILTFRYTEPMTYWVGLPKDKSLTRENVQSAIRSWAANPGMKEQFELYKTSVMFDENGDEVFIPIDKPWCYGGVAAINSLPDIAGEITDFKTKWNDKIRQKWHTPGTADTLAGEYIDSSEGYLAPDIDLAHLTATKLPLTFSADSCIPGIWKGSIAFEYIREIRDDLRPAGEYVMANGTPGTIWSLPALLDVSGTETDWNPNGHWEPVSLSEFHYRRSLNAGKPYCFLMNSDFSKLGPSAVEKYMKRSLVFGMFPSFFSANAATGHYFRNPQLYERDRPLFKKYLPWIRKIMAEGWQVVPDAVLASDTGFAMEQYGKRFFAILNDGPRTAEAVIGFTKPEMNKAIDRLSGKTYEITDGKLSISLAPEDVALLELTE